MTDGKTTVLCVDDDVDVREILQLILTKNGYEPILAASAEEGLRMFGQSPPDLVIVDLMMEEIDSGVQFVTELKALGNTAPVFMLSSVGDSLSETVDTAALGLSGALQKPVQEGTLIALLKSKTPG